MLFLLCEQDLCTRPFSSCELVRSTTSERVPTLFLSVLNAAARSAPKLGGLTFEGNDGDGTLSPESKAKPRRHGHIVKDEEN